MSTRKKKIQLCEKDVTATIKYLERYKKQLVLKSQKFLEELSQKGIKVADKKYADAKGETTDKSHSYVKSIAFDGKNVTMDFAIQGEDIVFVEFGAGVYYNKQRLGENVHDSEAFRNAFPEYKIGKYGTNGEKQYSLGAKNAWHYNGELTHGTQATMPLFSAQLAMQEIKNIRDAANKAFKNWS